MIIRCVITLCCLGAGVAQAAIGLDELAEALERHAAKDHVAAFAKTDLTNALAGWVATGLEVTQDQSVTLFGDGEIDAGIVRKPVDIALSDATEVSFQWRYRALPALGPETEAGFHDYLSIAIEFDNGQDITWMWAKHIDADQSFHCPLDWWDQRETHIVIIKDGDTRVSVF